MMLSPVQFVAEGLASSSVHPVFAGGMRAAMRRPDFVAAAVHSLRQQADRARARHHDSEVEAIKIQIEKLLENEEPING